MSIINKTFTFLLAISLFTQMTTSNLQAVTYVTDTGGYAYDEARAATNLAPAIALGTVAIVAIVAIAVQNSHGSSSHSSGFSHYGSTSSSSYSNNSSFNPSSGSSFSTASGISAGGGGISSASF